MAILLSNTFILFLFNFNLKFKKYTQILSEINFSYTSKINKKNKIKPWLGLTSTIFYSSRNFSTSAFNSNYHYENDPELKANRLELAKNKSEDKKKNS